MARLKFYARGTAQVTDPHAQERGVRRCIARRWQEVLPGRWSWVPTEKPQEVESHQDLVRACQDGDLWPADEATAAFCKVAFDPSFSGEDTETIKAWKAKREAATAAPPPPEKSDTKTGKVVGGKGDV